MPEDRAPAGKYLLLIVSCLVLVVWQRGPAGAADDAATFELTADITWSAVSAPLDFPSSAHLSRLIGATHHG